MPILQQLPRRHMLPILAKGIYRRFTLQEYEQTLDGLSPRGLSGHLEAESLRRDVQ